MCYILNMCNSVRSMGTDLGNEFVPSWNVIKGELAHD